MRGRGEGLWRKLIHILSQAICWLQILLFSRPSRLRKKKSIFTLVTQHRNLQLPWLGRSLNPQPASAAHVQGRRFGREWKKMVLADTSSLPGLDHLSVSPSLCVFVTLFLLLPSLQTLIREVSCSSVDRQMSAGVSSCLVIAWIKESKDVEEMRPCTLSSYPSSCIYKSNSRGKQSLRVTKKEETWAKFELQTLSCTIWYEYIFYI